MKSSIFTVLLPSARTTFFSAIALTALTFASGCAVGSGPLDELDEADETGEIGEAQDPGMTDSTDSGEEAEEVEEAEDLALSSDIPLVLIPANPPLTCKPYHRGMGSAPTEVIDTPHIDHPQGPKACSAGLEWVGGRCFPRCLPPYRGIGAVCSCK